MENVGTIFNIVLSSANKGEKYEKKVPVPGKKCYTLAKQRSDKSEFIKENIDETIFMFTFFKCRKSDKGRN